MCKIVCHFTDDSDHLCFQHVFLIFKLLLTYHIMYFTFINGCIFHRSYEINYVYVKMSTSHFVTTAEYISGVNIRPMGHVMRLFNSLLVDYKHAVYNCPADVTG